MGCEAPCHSLEMSALTKKEMVRKIAAELDADQVLTKRVVQRMLDMVLDTVVEEGRLELRNFGVFEAKVRAARKARNPKTNEEVHVPAKRVLSFQAGKKVAARFAAIPLREGEAPGS